MAYEIKQSQRSERGSCVLTFSIEGHPDNPVLELNTKDYASGKQMKEKARVWADQHGARLD